MTYLLILLSAFLSWPTFATVDGHDRMHIVVEDIQSGDFFLERVPLIACYGLPQGARLSQFVSEYYATSNIGCGGPVAHDNINALSCAEVIEATESSDYMSFRRIKLDISACAAKNTPRFITLVRTAAKYNFPQTNGREVELILVK
ncbi:MAG: hypothetical protein AB7G93_10435 [Bdellovibrionales bacterium]